MFSEHPYKIGLDMLMQEKYSDLSIICQGVEFKVHRAIVCPRSPMLEAACGGQFKEAETGRMEFHEILPSIMSRVVFYIYTGEFIPSKVPPVYQGLCADPDDFTDDEPGNNPTAVTRFKSLGRLERDAAKISALVYKCADIMMMDDLKSLTASQFLEYTRTHFKKKGFHDALLIMCESIGEADQGLRAPAMDIMLQQYGSAFRSEKKIPEKTVEVLKQYSAGLWDLAILRERNSMEEQVRLFIDHLNRKPNLRCKHQKEIFFSSIKPRNSGSADGFWDISTGYTPAEDVYSTDCY